MVSGRKRSLRLGCWVSTIRRPVCSSICKPGNGSAGCCFYSVPLCPSRIKDTHSPTLKDRVAVEKQPDQMVILPVAMFNVIGKPFYVTEENYYVTRTIDDVTGKIFIVREKHDDVTEKTVILTGEIFIVIDKIHDVTEKIFIVTEKISIVTQKSTM